MQTPSTRFRPRNDKHVFPILQAYISIYGKEAPKYSTQIQILPKMKWNQKKQVFDGNTKEEQANNAILDNIRATVKNCFTLMQSEKSVINCINLKKRFIKIWEKEAIETLTLVQVYERFLKIKDEDPNLEEKTIERYYTVKDHLIKFLKEKKLNGITIDELNIQHGTMFFNYIKDQINTKTQRNISPLTAKRYLKYLQASVDDAFQNGLIPETSFLKASMKVKKPATNKTKISEQQQLLIYNLDDLTRTERHVADITTFLFYTGFDYCDIEHFDFEKHLNNGVISKPRYKQRKQEDPKIVHIKVNNILDEILRKYEAFPLYPDQTIRTVYKKLCSRVGVKNFKKMTLKQIRKSGGTFYLNNGVPLHVVSEGILGHTSVQMTQRHYTELEQKSVLKYTEHLQNRE